MINLVYCNPFCFIKSKLKTLVLDTLNPPCLISVSTVDTFNFLLNPLFWIFFSDQIHINQVFYLLCINTFMKTFQLHSMICLILQLNQIEQNHINLSGFFLKHQNVFLPLYSQSYGIRLNQSLKKLNLQNCLKEKSSKTIQIVMQVIPVKKITVFHVDKLNLCYLLHPVIHKHVSNNICYPLFQPFC